MGRRLNKREIAYRTYKLFMTTEYQDVGTLATLAEISRGNHMSASQFGEYLKELERQGLVERRVTHSGRAKSLSSWRKIMKIWVDANPTTVALVREDEVSDSRPLHPRRTVNEAEYLAVLFGLTEAPRRDVIILSDSQLVVKQLNREWHVKKPMLRELAIAIWHHVATRKEEGFKTTFKWVRREENKAGFMLP